MDAGEDAAASAVRELREETGYVGEVVRAGWGTGFVLWNGESVVSARVARGC